LRVVTLNTRSPPGLLRRVSRPQVPLDGVGHGEVWRLRQGFRMSQPEALQKSLREFRNNFGMPGSHVRELVAI
jgi:hypothetical protein